VKEREEERRRQRRPKAREADQRRRDTALLASFASEKGIRRRARAQHRTRSTGASAAPRRAIKDIDKRLAKIDEEMGVLQVGRAQRARRSARCPRAVVVEQERLMHEKQASPRASPRARRRSWRSARLRPRQKRWIDLRTGRGREPAPNRK
jgi:hypothetical protein